MKKKIFLGILSLILTMTVYSQRRITKDELSFLDKKVKELNLLQEDSDFKNASVNDPKWEDESAIILSQKTIFTFDKEGASAGRMVKRNLLGILFAPVTLGASVALANSNTGSEIQIIERERRKILLRDNYAVDQYSIMYFRLNSGDAFAARVIKKNGPIQPINPADAIAENNIDEIPSIYTCYTDPTGSRNYDPRYFKIPIENLEPGDIIEYELLHYNTQSFYSNLDYKEFEPIYYSCSRELPVVKQSIEVVSENDNYYLSHKSLRGAPEFTNEFRGSNKVFRWADDTYRVKSNSISYVNAYREMPAIKFQVLYARNNSKQYLWFNSPEDMKKDLSIDDLASHAKTFWYDPEKLGSTGSYFSYKATRETSDDIYKWLKKHDVTKASDDEYVQKTYYLLRAYTVNQGWNDYKFAKIFSALLDEKELEHDIVVTPYNTRTNIANLAFSNELAWAVKYNKKFYINPESHFNPGEIPVYLTGNVCVRFPYNDQKASYKTDTLTKYTYNQSTLTETIKATLEPNGKSDLTVESLTTASGLVKDNVIDEALAYYPYLEKDYQNYDGEATNASSKYEETKKEWREKDKPEYMKSRVEQDLNFEVEKYDLFQLVNDGRSFKKQNLEYKEKYTLSRVTSFAGNDILIGLPSLIGSQTQISKKEQGSRQYDIDLKNARSFNWHIEMPVPAGYTTAGFENITFNVDNKYASFISSGKVENGKVIIDAVKTYKVSKMVANDWQMLVEMLNAAHNFSQSKIVFIKE